MLLREYLLLHLGRISESDAAKWLSEMTTRRKADASRDLLAFGRPAEGHLTAFPVLGLNRFRTPLTLDEVRSGLERVVVEVRSHYPDVALRAVTLAEDAQVASGIVVLDLGGHEPAAVSNAFAYHFEQAFGYAQAAKHPVAYEESLRPS